MKRVMPRKNLFMFGFLFVICLICICAVPMSGYCANATNPAYAVQFTEGNYTYGRANEESTAVSIVDSSLTTIENGRLEIPSSVTHDGITYTVVGIVGTSYEKNTFDNVTGLDNSSVEVVFPDSIKEIHDYVFRGANWIKKVTFGSNSQLSAIYSQVFQDSKIIEITLPDSVKELGNHVFNGAKNLTDIYLGNGINKIESATFSNPADSLTIHIPASAPLFTNSSEKVKAAVEAISDKLSVYGDCNGVKYEQIKGTTNVSAISITNFDEATRKETYWPIGQKERTDGIKPESKEDCVFEIPSKVTLANKAEYTVTKVEGYKYPGDTNTAELMKGQGFYNYRDRINKVVLPETVTEIGECAFYGFGANPDVSDFRINLPRRLTKMGDRAFQACSYLKTINIPGTLKTIPYAAFAGCVYMKEAVIGKGVETIEPVAFLDCGKSANAVSTANDNIKMFILIPGTVTNLATNAFNGVNSSITKFYTDSDNIKTLLEGKKFSVKKVNVNNYGKSLKLLSIGNSFSRNTMENLYHIALDQGFTDIELGYFYYPGASITRHWKMATNAESLKNAENAVTELTNYHYFRWENNGWYDYSMSEKEAQAWITDSENAAVKPSDIFEYGIKDKAWDIIDLQLSSIEADGGVFDKLDELLGIVDGLKNTDTKYGCLQTWAFSEDSKHGQYLIQYKDKGLTPIDQYNDIITNSNIILRDYNGKITYFVPSGTAVQNMRTTYVGDNLSDDGYHMNMLGSYISSMTLLRELTGATLGDVTYKTNTEKLSDEDLRLAKWAVDSAMKNKFAITEAPFEDQYKVSYDKTDGIATINIKSRAYSKPVAIKAEYNKGTLQAANITALKYGKDSTVTGLNGNDTKLFIWDLANGMIPLCDVKQ